MKFAFLIPAFNPSKELSKLINGIDNYNTKHIIIVDDGSNTPQSRQLLNKIKSNKLTILRHDKNLGKGAALKTGLKYIVDNYSEVENVITIDADGQHRPIDISDIMNATENSIGQELILASRIFSNDTPWKSKLGNYTIRYLFKCITGKYLSDTQTGLRSIPVSIIPKLLGLKGNRFDFELEAIWLCVQLNINIKETHMDATYLNNNNDSHFRPILDSICILKKLIKFKYD